MIGGQQVQAGLPHAGKTAGVTVESGACQVTVDPGIAVTVPQTASRDIRRHKAYSYQQG
jgi:hypothetical protein